MQYSAGESAASRTIRFRHGLSAYRRDEITHEPVTTGALPTSYAAGGSAGASPDRIAPPWCSRTYRLIGAGAGHATAPERGPAIWNRWAPAPVCTAHGTGAGLDVQEDRWYEKLAYEILLVELWPLRAVRPANLPRWPLRGRRHIEQPGAQHRAASVRISPKVLLSTCHPTSSGLSARWVIPYTHRRFPTDSSGFQHIPPGPYG